MNCKLLGAMLLVSGFGCGGFLASFRYRRAENELYQLLKSIELIECELRYRMSPLPELCRIASVETNGAVSRIWRSLAVQLDQKSISDVQTCMETVLEPFSDLPKYTRQLFHNLGECMGRFDAEGQCKGLDAVKELCRQRLAQMSVNRDARLRSYQIVGICAGVATAILLF